MKILMLTPYLPYPLLSGGQIRTYNLLKKLSSKHEITLFSLIKDESEKKYVSELEQYCSSVKVFKRSKRPFTLKNILKTGFSSYPFLVIRNHVPEVVEAVKIYLDTHQPDLIHAETFYMMPHIPKTDIPTILVEQTIEYLGYESYSKKAPAIIRPLLNVDIKKITFWEKYYWNSCDLLVVMSQDDKNLISEKVAHPDKIEVVENGVATEWFQEKQRQEPEHPTVLSVGTFKWLPNIEAVTFLVEEVWPLIKVELPEARLRIVGNEPTAKIMAYQDRDTSIEVTGRVEDIRDAFSTANILMAPVFSGKGTRYKILEAMATCTPVIATPTAVEGLNITPGKQCLIGETKEEMAQQAIRLLQDTKLQEELANNAFNYVSSHFDWKLIAQKLDNLYKRVGERYA